MKFYLEDLKDTTEFGQVLARLSGPGDVFLLQGELGSGKTSLCRGFLREFTGDLQLDVPSPSYLISLQYNREGIDSPTVYHLDPYRLSVGNVGCLLDFENAVSRDILLIEWPSRLGEEVSSLINCRAKRVMTISFDGVGPQAIGRSVDINVRDTDVERHWLDAVNEEWQKVGVHGEQTRAPKEARIVNQNFSHVAESAVVNMVNLTAEDLSKVLILGIESSCDDTAVAIVRGDGKIVAQCIASQGAVHVDWGGVVPKLAQEAHAKAITATVDACLEEAQVSAKDLSAIAVTVGPGLGLCLLVGIGKAIDLACEFQVPLLRIHHMEAHMMVTRLPGLCMEAPAFPFITLLVSGGHTMIVLTRDIGNHLILGSTIDDSVGEAFDKTARLLGITAVPGGKALEDLAKDGSLDTFSLPKPLSRTKDATLRKSCDMSFAGLKTAVLMVAQKQTTIVDDNISWKKDLAASFQKTCADHLAERLQRAIQLVLEGPEPLVEAAMKHIVVAGGVAANKTVRAAVEQVAHSFGLTVCAPPTAFCADNGVMVAWTGIERFARGLAEPPPKTKGEQYAEARPRWPLGLRHSACNGKINDSAGKPMDRKARDMAKISHVNPS